MRRRIRVGACITIPSSPGTRDATCPGPAAVQRKQLMQPCRLSLSPVTVEINCKMK